jgi:hypothetical protein
MDEAWSLDCMSTLLVSSVDDVDVDDDDDVDDDVEGSKLGTDRCRSVGPDVSMVGLYEDL